MARSDWEHIAVDSNLIGIARKSVLIPRKGLEQGLHMLSCSAHQHHQPGQHPSQVLHTVLNTALSRLSRLLAMQLASAACL